MAKQNKETANTANESTETTGANAAPATDETTSTQSPASTEGASADGTAKKTGKGSRKGQPIPIGPRRLLGLAIRGLMAEVENGSASSTSPGYIAAQDALTKNKYTELRPQAERLAEVQEKLQAAIAAGDGAAIVKLGKELNRINSGL